MGAVLKKEVVLSTALDHLQTTREKITEEIGRVNVSLDYYRQGRGEDEIVRQKLLGHFSDQLDQLHHLFPSPYFIRCDVTSNQGEKKTLYFSKFSFMEQSIFSWMTAAARVRFSEIGPISYPLTDGGQWSGTLMRKDQFMIVGGKIIFMTSETDDYGRTLIHQEQLSQKKAGFMLPEIVEKMEKAQDDVIRAPEHGSFLIGGPAGSGKTTLALHRLAYLMQSPDTAARFSAREMIVFVQDDGTKAYFSRLLPDLGIHNVAIVTFGEWALNRLKLKDFTFIRRPNGVDETIDGYESHKCQAMHAGESTSKRYKHPIVPLQDVYASTFTPDDDRFFKKQMEDHQLDRFDLTILLKHALRTGPLTETRDFFVPKKNSEVVRKQHDVPLSYSLIVVDEAQNYLPEQVTILRSCVAEETKAMLYVGDLGQQVLLGTVRDWSSVGEIFAEGQHVQLEKVYRNTRSILTYLKGLGFPTIVPEGLREGTAIVDAVCSTDEEFRRIKTLVETRDTDMQIGILSPSDAYLKPYRASFADHSNIHILSIHEAQGVEFECVILVGVPTNFFNNRTNKERLRIKKDLIYVALTRAMDELYIFGRQKLQDILAP